MRGGGGGGNNELILYERGRMKIATMNLVDPLILDSHITNVRYGAKLNKKIFT